MKTKRPRLRIMWCTAALASCVGLYALLGFRVAPELLRSQLSEHLRERYGISLRIDELELNPFTLRVQARRLSALDAETQPLIEADRLTVDVALWSSLRHRAYALSELSLLQPTVHIRRRRDGTTNLERLVSSQPESEAESASRPLRVESLDVRGAQVRFVGYFGKRPLQRRLQDVALSIHGLRTDAGAEDFVFFARTGAGAQLGARGSLQLAPVLESRGTIALHELSLRELEPLIRDVLPLASLDGRLGLRGTYGISSRAGARSEIALDGLSVQRMQLVPRFGAPVLVDLLQLTDVRVAPMERSLAIGRITVVRPRTILTRAEDGTVALSAANHTPSLPTAHPESVPWSVQVRAVQVEAGRLELRQEGRGGTVKVVLTPIEVSLRGLSLDRSMRIPVEVSAGVESGGQISLRGQLLPSPLSADLELKISELELSPASALLEELLPLRLHAGALDVEGYLDLAQDHQRARFAGDVSLSGLRVRELGASEDLARARRIAAEGVDAQETAIAVQRLRLEQPYARLVLERDGKLNVTRLKSSDVTPPPEAHTGPAPELRVAALEIVDMSLDFSDLSTNPRFALPIRAMNGAITGLSSRPNRAARLQLHGDVAHGSSVSIQGHVQPFALTKQTDVRLHAGNISLPIFNPYSGPYAGYSIDRGELNTEVHYRVRDDRLRAEHEIRIDQLKWGEATEEKPKAPLPVKLATVLLRDRSGTIRLELPLQGSLDEPSFRVGPLLWQMVKNVIIKAAAAPFDLLGKWFRGAEQARDVEFAPGEIEPSQRSQRALAALREALVEREELIVAVPTATAEALDRVAIADRKLHSAIDLKLSGRRKERRRVFAKLKVEDQVDVLEDLYKERTGKAATLDRGQGRRTDDDLAKRKQLEKILRDETPVSNEELAELGQARAQAVERHLLADGRLPATRVILSRTGSVKADGAMVKLRLELQ